jgi:hypothetical protein
VSDDSAGVDSRLADWGDAIQRGKAELDAFAELIQQFLAAAAARGGTPEQIEMLDEAAGMTAELDQARADWEERRARYEAALARRGLLRQRLEPATPMLTCILARPRARAARPRRRSRAARAAVSRQGDSGDDPGEPDGPAVARLGRAIWHALARIARRLAP